jgi:EcoRII C terminal
MPLRLAVKRLSAVETDPARSHQHEFHAGRLRGELELPDERLSGTLSALIFGADGESPAFDESAFTLYDARQENPDRAAEWRLFYASRLIPEAAEEGDLLILYRYGEDLRALVVRAGTRVERDLLEALSLGDAALRTQFAYLDVPTPDEREAREVAGQLTLPEATQTLYEVTDHALFHRAIGEGRLPSTAEMADAAASIAFDRGSRVADPDAYLFAALAAESDLYFAIEDGVQQVRLTKLLSEGPGLTDIIDFSMSIQQSRRSRRGQSLQNHFATILVAEGIPFTAQCTTEGGETPDFVVPGCRQYHDPEYPDDGLRMVACKSTAKERWRQVLHEAERVPDKYLLTVDPGLTGSTIEAMLHAGVVPFLPQAVIDTAYKGHDASDSLASVANLIERLQVASHGSTYG